MPQSIKRIQSVNLPFYYDKGVGRYRDASGQFVARSAILRGLEEVIENTRQDARAVSRRLMNGEIDTNTWQSEMMRITKDIHTIGTSTARGGFDKITAGDTDALSESLQFHLRKLNEFGEEIRSGKLLDGRFLARADLYAKAGRNTYVTMERRVMEELGFDEERNVIRAQESCEGCIHETDRGWVEIGELVPTGHRDCMQNCLCVLEFRNTETGEVLYWNE